MRLRSAITLISSTLMVGCATFGPASKLALDNAIGQPAEGEAIPVTPQAADSSPVGPTPEMTELEAMAAIAPSLAKIAASDPQLHAEVLDQLGGTKPNLWSLAVQRAEQTLEYRQQLASSSKANSVPPPATPQAMLASSETPSSQTPAPPAIPQPQQEPEPQSEAVALSTHPAGLITNEHFQASHADRPAEEVSTQMVSYQTSEPQQSDLDWRDHLAEAIDAFRNKESIKPRNSAESADQIRLRLMQLAAGQSEEASTAPAGLSASESGYWTNQMFAMATLLDDRSSSRQARIDAATDRQEEASAQLRSMGALQVRNFAACKAVYGFGAYEPTPEARYTAGEQVVLYAEIDNYQSDASREGYRTQISSSYRLLDPQGEEIAQEDFPEVDDLCLTRRRDFHIRYVIPLPGDLRPGDYTLELTVNDRLADKIGHSDLRLTVDRR